MTIEFKLPELGENVETGDIVRVLVSVGDTLKKDQPVLEIETDKATIEVPSSVSGVVKEIHIKEGDQAAVGQTILTVDSANGQTEPEPQQPASETKNQSEPISQPEPKLAKEEKPSPSPGRTMEFKLPDLGENVSGGDVLNILVSVGDKLKKDQPVLEVETDKATIEIPSSVNGVVKATRVQAGDNIKVGQTIFIIEVDSAQIEPATKTEPPAKPEPVAAPKPEPVQAEPTPAAPPIPAPPAAQPDKPRQIAPAAPSVRRLARELGVDINEVPGTGPAGRISQQDVKNYVKKLNKERRAAPTPAVAAPAQPELPDFSRWGEIERERMGAVRRATARQMNLAWAHIPHVTNFDKADITELEKLRKLYGKRAEAAGGKLTVTAIILKVVAAALKQFPKFNASIDIANEEVIYKNYYHLGVAVDTERGLLVPSIRDVDKKNIIELSVELSEVAKKARDRKLTLEELQGSTFTITNLGGIGGVNFTPIINHPEVAILGIARSSVEAVHTDGKFEPRLMMPLALSYDHRLIDGADAARFLRWVAEAIEQPFLLALEG